MASCALAAASSSSRHRSRFVDLLKRMKQEKGDLECTTVSQNSFPTVAQLRSTGPKSCS